MDWGALIGVAGTLIANGINWFKEKFNRESNEDINEENAITQKQINADNIAAQQKINAENIAAVQKQNEIDWQHQLQMNEWNAEQQDKINTYNANMQQSMNDFNADQINKVNQLNYKMNAENNATNIQMVRETNALNREVANQNLEFQKQQQNYEESLQREIFEREDNTYQRTIADMRAAGLSPLAMAGLNGAGSVVGRTVSNNTFQAQSAQTNAATANAFQGTAATANAFTGGKSTQGQVALAKAANSIAWKKLAYQNSMNYLEASGQLNDIIQDVANNKRAERQIAFNEKLQTAEFIRALEESDRDYSFKREEFEHQKYVDQFDMDNKSQKNKLINAAIKTLGKKFGVDYQDDGTIGLSDNGQTTKVVNDAKEKLVEIYEETKEALEETRAGRVAKGIGKGLNSGGKAFSKPFKAIGNYLFKRNK